jgi:hypothetical protein
MGKIVLLAVAAAWVAVLLPPLLRSRMENRPGSSVTDFRRQLSTLQRTVPTRGITPMRTARPFAPSSISSNPLSKPAVTHQRATVAQRSHGPAAGYDRDLALTGELERRVPRGGGAAPRHRAPQRISRRELVRRRRANVLFVLVVANALSLFLAATTKSQTMVYAFAFAFVSLCGYCYKLAQIRAYEYDRQHTETHWFHAA